MKSDNRYLGAAMIAPLFIFIFLGGLPLKIFVAFLSVIGMYEFYHATRAKGVKPIISVGYIMLIVYYALNNDLNILSSLLVIGVFISLIIPVFNLKRSFIDIGISILGFIYVGVFFSFIYLVSAKEQGQYYVWLIFIASWMTDTAAYYAGSFFGKHKLCPEISPKKTIEGSIGGLLGSAVCCTLFGAIISDFTTVMPIYHFLIIGLLCGGLSQLGDLVASSIKRYVGIKDYSNLIPGHGGILDRFDSIIFSAVVIFYYLTIFIK